MNPLSIPPHRLRVTFRKLQVDTVHVVTGRRAQTLFELTRAGLHGVTALEISSWALRLASYVYDLRHDYGLEIRTEQEPHEGGTHARYVLDGEVQIIEVAEKP